MSDKRSDFRVVGLTSIRMGEVPGQASTTYMVGSSSMNTLGNFVPDSAHMLIDAENVNDFLVEDKTEVDCQTKMQGRKTVEFATRDMGPAMLAFLMGGTASGVTTYLAPQTAQVINEKSIEVVTKPINGKRYLIDFPRTSVSHGGDLRFGRSETGTLTISAVVMQPYSSVAPYRMTLQV